MVSVCNGCSRGSPAISTASGWTPNLQFELDEFARHKRASISRYLRSFQSRNDSACSSGRKSSTCSTRRILAMPFPSGRRDSPSYIAIRKIRRSEITFLERQGPRRFNRNCNRSCWTITCRPRELPRWIRTRAASRHSIRRIRVSLLPNGSDPYSTRVKH